MKNKNVLPEIKVMQFVKEMDGSWYIELPEWKGDRADLQMVAGADTFLDILSEGEDMVNLSVSEEYFDGSIKITKMEETPDIGGAIYLVENVPEMEKFPIWLCDVVRFIYNKMPKKLYINN